MNPEFDFPFGKCICCEQPLLQPRGYAGTDMCGPCTTGEADTIGEVTDGGWDNDIDYRETKRARVTSATELFREASQIANAAGLRLIRHNEQHYSLRGKDWILNLYPSNCRIYQSDKTKGPGNLQMQGVKWTLPQAVQAVVKKLERATAGTC